MIEPPGIGSMLTVVSADAIVIASSHEHNKWLGRNNEGVVGHSCGEWSHPDHWNDNFYNFQLALAQNRIMSWSRSVIRSDGLHRTGILTVRPFVSRNKQTFALCSTSIVEPRGKPSDTSVAFAREVLRYVEDMSRQLSQMSADRGALSLSMRFDEVIAEAAASAARLEHELTKMRCGIQPAIRKRSPQVALKKSEG